jgi:hypothetical protein
MGMKSKPQMPPPVDTSVIEATKAKEASLEAEKKKMLKNKSGGQYGTILTSGMGDTENASTAKTLLGGTIT